MKTFLFVPILLDVFSIHQSHAATTAGSAIALERGAHHAVWQWTTPEGETNEFTELRTGMNRWSGDSFIPANDSIEQVNGVYLARQSAHQVIFAPSADAAEGAIDLQLPDGSRFRVRPAGLAYTEFDQARPGRSAFVLELQNASPELTAHNQVTYFDAMEGVDLQYDLSLAGLEQNVVVHQRLPRPSAMGLSEKLVRVEVWNEILESAQPTVETTRVTRPDGSKEDDHEINLGAMQFAAGRAFLVGESKLSTSTHISKSWTVIDDKVWLIESLPYAEFEALTKSLPAGQASTGGHRFIDALDPSGDGHRRLPARLSQRETARVQAPRERQWAQAVRKDRAAAVLDWSLLSSATNALLKGDSTYYCSGPATFSSSGGLPALTIEGGACVKFTNATTTARITVLGAISCQTSAYRPAVFTSKDDNTVGETIPGSSGTPGNNYYGAGLAFNGGTLHDLQFINSSSAVSLLANSQTLTLQDSQFVQCSNVVTCGSLSTVKLENCLIDGVANLVTGTSNNSIVGQHLTVHDCDVFANVPNNSSTVILTNCLLAPFEVANRGNATWSTYNQYYNQALPSDFALFQTVGAGSHYLAVNSPYVVGGITNIDASLLARLRQKTVHPPRVLTTNFTGNTLLAPRNLREPGASSVALGYHYDVLDYAWSGLNLTNATLTLTNGVAVAIYGPGGTTLRNGAKFVSEGSPSSLNHLVRYNAVQEQPVLWGTFASSMHLLELNAGSTVQAILRFTDVSLLADSSSRRRILSSTVGSTENINPFALAHSQLRGVYCVMVDSGTAGRVVAWTNNVFERCTFSWTQSDYYHPFTLHLFNNLFYKGTNTFTTTSASPAWTVKDNLFDCDALTKTGTPTFAASNNGYRSGLTSLGGSGNKTGLVPDYLSSFLGGYYYPVTGSSTSLTNLIDAGSRTASAAGLSAYTTITNQTADSGTVDIGYHSYAVSTNTIVTIEATAPIAVEDGSPGLFTVYRTGPTTNNLTVYYNVSGTAVPGVDYGALPGSVVIPLGSDFGFISVTPTSNSVVTFDKTVVATLVVTNTYSVGSPNQATVTIVDDDPVSGVGKVANLNAPVGMDYHSGNSNLILSVNFSADYVGGSPANFARLNSSGTSNNWTSLSGMGYPDLEIKLATIKVAANGWTNNDLYFGTSRTGRIGRISANGSSYTTNWATLSGEANFLGGSLYQDQTGVFNHDLIVVSGRHPDNSWAGGAVWRVTTNGSGTKLAEIESPNGNRLLEGLLTLPNDPAKYGPWAGKIVTCQVSSGLIWTVDTNGVATSYDLGIEMPADLRLIPPVAQSLYCAAVFTNAVWKVPAANWTAFAGDVLVVNEFPASLFAVHWDGVRFVLREMAMPSAVTWLEHTTFAPIEIPVLP